MRWLLAGWFLTQWVGMGCLGALDAAYDRENPSAPAWLIGGLIMWVAWRVVREHGPIRGALAAQALIAWLPFFVAVFPASRCLTGLYRTLGQLEVLLMLNGAALVLAVGAHLVERWAGSGRSFGAAFERRADPGSTSAR